MMKVCDKIVFTLMSIETLFPSHILILILILMKDMNDIYEFQNVIQIHSEHK